MKNKIILLITYISLFFTANVLAQFSWERAQGLPGGNIKASVEFNSKKYIMTDKNLYSSTDGRTWEISLEAQSDQTFLDLTKNDEAIWISVNTQDKILYSTDGTNWQVTNQGFEGIMFAFTIYGHKKSVYAYISDGYLYRKDSLNGTWNKLSQVGSLGSILKVEMADSLLFAYGNRTEQFGGSNFLVSSDSGKTFTAMGKTDNLPFTDSFAFPSATLDHFIQLDDSLYSVTANQLGIFSIHFGDSLWDKKIPTGNNLQIPRATQQIKDNDHIIVATASGLFKTNLTYENGEPIGTGYPAGNISSFKKFNDGSYIIDSQTSGLLYLQDESSNYTSQMVKGINEGGSEEELLVSDNNNLLTSSNAGIYKSNNSGDSWENITSTLTEILGFEFFGDNNGGFGLFSGNDILFLRYQLFDSNAEERIRYFASEDGGVSWTKLVFNNNISIDLNAGISLTTSGDNYILSGFVEEDGTKANIYLSSDLSFEESERVFQSESAFFDDIKFFVIENILMRTTINSARERHLLVSTDGGSSWELKELNVDVGADFFNITNLVEYNGTLIAFYQFGSTPEKYNIYSSDDDGATWKLRTEGEDLFGVYHKMFKIDEQFYLVKLDGTMATFDVDSWTIEDQETIGKDLFGIGFASYLPSGNTIIGFNTEGIYRMNVARGTVVSNEEEFLSLPNTTSLRQNYPNPFNPSTVIPFQLNSATQVTLTVYDMMGRKVQTLLNNQLLSQGNYNITFNAGTLASGIYFYRLESGTNVLTKKMMLIK